MARGKSAEEPILMVGETTKKINHLGHVIKFAVQFLKQMEWDFGEGILF